MILGHRLYADLMTFFFALAIVVYRRVRSIATFVAAIHSAHSRTLTRIHYNSFFLYLIECARARRICSSPMRVYEIASFCLFFFYFIFILPRVIVIVV